MPVTHANLFPSPQRHMSALGDDLEEFLAKMLNARVLDKVRQVCIAKEIADVATLVELRDADLLERFFTEVTAMRIRRALEGQ